MRFRLTIGLALTAALALAVNAQAAPTASPQISATLGKYLPHLDDWEVNLQWEVNCPGGERFAWEIHLLDNKTGAYRFVTATGYSLSSGGTQRVLVQAQKYPFTVTPRIIARCYQGGVSSLRVQRFGGPITIPAAPVGGAGDGCDDGTGGGGDGGNGGGRGGGCGDIRGGGRGDPDGGGFTGRLPRRCDPPIAGTARSDVLMGTPGSDLILGFGGNDRIDGRGGSDCLLGFGGKDRLKGSGGNDLIDGGRENDRLYGGSGNDRLHGGRGGDLLVAGGGTNLLRGDSGNDRLSSVNGRRDRVNCGSGRHDLARVDRHDVVRRCELTRRP